MDTIFILAIGLTAFCTIALLCAPVLLRPSPEAQHILDVVTSNRKDRRTIRSKEIFENSVLKIAKDLRGRLGVSENVQLKKRLIEAGMRDKSTLDSFFAIQVAAPLLGAFAGSFMPSNVAFWIFAFAVVGYMSPDFWLTRKTSQRKKKIRRSIPDVLDLLVICVDAGLGLDQALLRVGSELEISHPEINEELTQINLEQRAGKPRLEAWQGLADRTRIEEFKAFVSMLMQTDKFGTPILKALNQFSEEVRLKRKQHAEEAAAKTKIKIIFPLVICIFPCVFIVLLAPAILSIVDGFKGWVTRMAVISQIVFSRHGLPECTAVSQAERHNQVFRCVRCLFQSGVPKRVSKIRERRAQNGHFRRSSRHRRCTGCRCTGSHCLS